MTSLDTVVPPCQPVGTMATPANFETVVTRLPDGVDGAVRLRDGGCVVLVLDDRLSSASRSVSVERLSVIAARLLTETAA